MIKWRDFDINSFRQKLEISQECALLLDYDGTLAPFRDAKERNLALPYPGVRERLLRIINNRKKTRVVIISARPVSEISQLIDLDPSPEIWGIYGWERQLPNGVYYGPSPQDPAVVSILQNTIEWADRNEIEWEAKPDAENPVSVAFHWRIHNDVFNRSSNELQNVIELYTDRLVEDSSLLVKNGDHVRELLIPGRDKGYAVQALLSELDSSSFVAYLGDSLGDEDAFEAVSSKGLGVLVNMEDRLTAATLHITPPSELLQFLELWIER